MKLSHINNHIKLHKIHQLRGRDNWIQKIKPNYIAYEKCTLKVIVNSKVEEKIMNRGKTQKDRKYQRNRIVSLEIDSHLKGQLFFEKCAKAIQWRKDGISTKDVGAIAY